MIERRVKDTSDKLDHRAKTEKNARPAYFIYSTSSFNEYTFIAQISLNLFDMSLFMFMIKQLGTRVISKQCYYRVGQKTGHLHAFLSSVVAKLSDLINCPVYLVHPVYNNLQPSL